MRARAGAGEYRAGVEVCLVDRAGFTRELAGALAGADYWRAVSMDDADGRQRWSSFRLYASKLRMAQFEGADLEWINRTVTADSVHWMRLDSLMRQ